MNCLLLKQKWQEELSPLYDPQEVNNIFLILAEELLPHYNKLAFRDPEFFFEADDISILEKALVRLKKNEPLQYILGKAWFYDLELKVNKHVLIPRPETEELVQWILDSKPKAGAGILDIGTGSACIPLSLAKHLPSCQVSAVDVDANALKVAKENAQDLKLPVTFHLLDILNESEWQTLNNYDIIVSNPPYIPREEKKKMRTNVLSYEPHLALFVEDNNSLIFYQKIADFALQHLNNNGILFFECNEFNAKDCLEMLQSKGFQELEIKKDLQGKDRMLKGSMKTP